MTSKYPIKLLLTMCLITFMLSFEDSYGEFTWDLRRQLPELPEGILEAGDIQLTEDRSMTDINIPGLTRTESEYGVLFWNRKAKDKISTLDKEGAKKLAGTFLDKYFPSLSVKKAFSGCGIYSTTHTVAGKEESVVTGYSVKYTCMHKSIPILNHKIIVTITGDNVVGVEIQAYSVIKLGNTAKLLSVKECLSKAPENLKQKYEGFTVSQVRFGYKGGFRQDWESDKDNCAKPFRAVPVYEFFIVRGLMASFRFVLDARTAELIYPKKPEGKKEIVLSGPELKFTGADSYEMFLIGPEDVVIEKAVFEMENVPINDKWLTYSVKEIFTDIGEWRFTNYDNTYGTFIVLNSNQDHSSKAVGTFGMKTPGQYEVEILVFQGEENSHGRAVQISIDEESRVLGTKGPNTARIWEKWGIIELVKGKHKITLGTAPGSLGYWEIGSLRFRDVNRTGVSVVKDLRICDYHDASPQVGHFETENLASNLRFGFHNRISHSINGRNICSVLVSSASPGVLRIHSLRISFVTGDQKLAEEKAKQFVLIYPDGNSSRPILAEELKIFATYVRRVIDSTKGVERNPFKLINLCSLVKRFSMKCESEGATQVRAELDTMYIQLAQEEAERLAWSFQGYANDWPKPESFPNKWPEALNMWYRGDLDGNRLTNDGAYLDPWGNPYILKYFHKEKRIQIHSYGSNGRDDGGVGDDIKAEHGLEWPPR